MKIKFLVVFIILFLVSCSSPENLTTRKLPSGKEIKLISIGKMYFKEGPPALMLKYQTDISIDNVDLLRKEVEEIWPVFRVNVEKSGLSNAMIMATSPPISKALFFHTTRSFNFVVSKKENGTWDFNTWNRNYDKEAESIGKVYLESYNNGDPSNVVKLLHYPAHFTQEQLNNDMNGIVKVLGVVTEKLGSLDSYELNNSQLNYLFLALQTASPEYWNKYPFFNCLIYDVNYSEKGAGYLIFRFSIIDDKLVIHSILFALPADNPESENILKELNESIMKAFSSA